MGQPAQTQIVVSDFPGLVSNVDRKDLPEGAADVQTNLVCQRTGELVTRKGYKEVTFESS